MATANLLMDVHPGENIFLPCASAFALAKASFRAPRGSFLPKRFECATNSVFPRAPGEIVAARQPGAQ